jgi:hypothetical protein
MSLKRIDSTIGVHDFLTLYKSGLIFAYRHSVKIPTFDKILGGK